MERKKEEIGRNKPTMIISVVMPALLHNYNIVTEFTVNSAQNLENGEGLVRYDRSTITLHVSADCARNAGVTFFVFAVVLNTVLGSNFRLYTLCHLMYMSTF
jgi:hypothetical protein